jgi:WD40 repeat protein
MEARELFPLQGLETPGHTLHVQCLEYSPDGKWIIAGMRDGEIRIWDTTNGSQLVTLSKHDGEVTSIAISQDGQQILSGSQDETVRLWDIANRYELARLRTSDENKPRGSQHAVQVAFSEGEKKILAISSDGTIRMWDAAAKCLVETCERGQGSWSMLTSPVQRRWLAEDRGMETWIYAAETREAVAWFPATFPYRPIMSDPPGWVFAGADGSHLYIFRLEGDL